MIMCIKSYGKITRINDKTLHAYIISKKEPTLENGCKYYGKWVGFKLGRWKFETHEEILLVDIPRDEDLPPNLLMKEWFSKIKTIEDLLGNEA